MRNDRRCGFSTLTARDLDRFGIAGIIQALRDRVGDSKVYISVDIDVLDPAYAPGECRCDPTVVNPAALTDFGLQQPAQRSLEGGPLGSF